MGIKEFLGKPHSTSFLQIFLVALYFLIYSFSTWLALVYSAVFFFGDLTSWPRAFQIHLKDRKFRNLIITIITTVIALIFFFANLYEIVGGVVYSSDINKEISGLWEHTYFSVVTFTTLGYGDLIPTGTSRYVAAIQAFLGLSYFAFLIGISSSIFNKKYLENS